MGCAFSFCVRCNVAICVNDHVNCVFCSRSVHYKCVVSQHSEADLRKSKSPTSLLIFSCHRCHANKIHFKSSGFAVIRIDKRETSSVANDVSLAKCSELLSRYEQSKRDMIDNLGKIQDTYNSREDNFKEQIAILETALIRKELQLKSRTELSTFYAHQETEPTKEEPSIMFKLDKIEVNIGLLESKFPSNSNGTLPDEEDLKMTTLITSRLAAQESFIQDKTTQQINDKFDNFVAKIIPSVFAGPSNYIDASRRIHSREPETMEDNPYIDFRSGLPAFTRD